MKWKKINLPQSIKMDPDSTSRYGRYYIEPLEKGFGVNLGNSLRRVLLSSIMGAGVVRVKIDGVLTEFSTIEGVKEDVPEIILNLKRLRIKINGELESAVLKIEAKGPGVIKAGDIETPALVEVMNPDLHIAELNEKGILKIEIFANVGRGYVTEEQHEKGDLPLGYIWLDTLYSPVEKVNFKVDNVRVGKRTDMDSLTIEVNTDGSISPDEALTYASTVLIDHYNLFVFNTIEIEETIEEKIDDEKERMKELLKMKVTELELSVRSANCLKSAKIETLEELVKLSETDVLRLKNFGRKSLTEITSILKSMGLNLGVDVNNIMND